MIILFLGDLAGTRPTPIKHQSFMFINMLLNGYKIYVDIMKREKFSSIKIANMKLIYWSVRKLSKRRGAG